MQKQKILKFVLGAFAGILLVAPFVAPADTVTTHQLTKEELVDLVKPSVVRIVNQIQGQVTIQPFSIDLNTFQAVPFSGPDPIVIPIDTTITGSGFVVNSSGDIMTNSHVVSYGEVRDQILLSTWQEVLYEQVLRLKPAEQQKIEDDVQNKYGDLSQAESDKIGDQVLNSLYAQAKFEITSKLFVLNPSSTANTLKDLLTDSFPATLVFYNSTFQKDQKDVAVVKIDKQNLPVLPLLGSSGLVSGQSISVFSFPSTATFNRQDWLEGSFSQGVISAIKDSDNKDFKIFQTDAKISTGSSGSPLLSSQGQVVGIITFETGSNSSSNGDNFAFALPAELGSQILTDKNIQNDDAAYAQSFIEALTYIDQRHCQLATAKINQVKAIDSQFAAHLNVQPELDKVSSLQKAGQCLDTKTDEYKDKLRHVNPIVWYGSGGGLILLVILIWIIVRQSRRMKKNEQQFSVLSQQMTPPVAPSQSHTDSMIVPAQPSDQLH